MDELRQLSELIGAYRPKQLAIIGKVEQDDKGNALFQYIRSHPEASVIDANEAIYGEINNAAFTRLKNRLKLKLYNTLFFLDLRGPRFSNYLRASHECLRDFSIFMLLRRFGMSGLAFQLATKIYRQAKKYEIDLTNQRARQFQAKDFQEFDLIYAMDAENYNNILKLSSFVKNVFSNSSINSGSFGNPSPLLPNGSG